MKTWLRRWLWVLALLIGLPLLLVLSWWLLNLADVEPQPWPQALELPRNNVPAADNLATILGAAPAIQGGSFSLGHCDGDDCVKRWRERLPKLAALRAANPGFGAVCEGLATRAELRFEDTMPERMSVDWPLPNLSALTNCHSWLLSRALEAAEGGDALHWLRQADRLDHALLAGSRGLVAQGVSASLWGNKLRVLVAMGAEHPSLSQELALLARFDEQTWLARQLDWVRVEASFQRGATDSLRASHCDDERLPMGLFERWFCRLATPVAQPEYMTQLMSNRWLRVQLHLQQTRSLPGSLQTLRGLLEADPVSRWQRIRHTVPHFLDDTAAPAYAGYFERKVDLQLAAEATRLWLQAQQRDLASRASPALRQRLSPLPDGAAGWQLTPHHDGSRGRLPLRWPPLS